MKNIKNLKPNKNSVYDQGFYRPQNPEKYIGDIHNIIYRSSWERKFCQYCDINPNITKWSSESLYTMYWNPIDKKEHKYFIDYYIQVKKPDDVLENWLIEIKPEDQYALHKRPKEPVGNLTEKKIRSYNEKLKTWITNRAKFEAATRFAESRGYKFGAINESFIMR
jgi:hypothetical protein